MSEDGPGGQRKDNQFRDRAAYEYGIRALSTNDLYQLLFQKLCSLLTTPSARRGRLVHILRVAIEGTKGSVAVCDRKQEGVRGQVGCPIGQTRKQR